MPRQSPDDHIVTVDLLLHAAKLREDFFARGLFVGQDRGNNLVKETPAVLLEYLGQFFSVLMGKPELVFAVLVFRHAPRPHEEIPLPGRRTLVRFRGSMIQAGIMLPRK